jgi:hypothetical protein
MPTAASSMISIHHRSTYLTGYASGSFVVSASFRRNPQNAHDGTIFHHPAKPLQTTRTGLKSIFCCGRRYAGCDFVKLREKILSVSRWIRLRFSRSFSSPRRAPSRPRYEATFETSSTITSLLSFWHSWKRHDQTSSVAISGGSAPYKATSCRILPSRTQLPSLLLLLRN